MEFVFEMFIITLIFVQSGNNLLFEIFSRHNMKPLCAIGEYVNPIIPNSWFFIVQFC